MMARGTLVGSIFLCQAKVRGLLGGLASIYYVPWIGVLIGVGFTAATETFYDDFYYNLGLIEGGAIIGFVFATLAIIGFYTVAMPLRWLWLLGSSLKR